MFRQRPPIYCKFQCYVADKVTPESKRVWGMKDGNQAIGLNNQDTFGASGIETSGGRSANSAAFIAISAGHGSKVSVFSPPKGRLSNTNSGAVLPLLGFNDSAAFLGFGIWKGLVNRILLEPLSY